MNIVQIQNRVQGMPNTPQTMQYLNAAMNGQVATLPPYIAAAELKRRETEGMMDQLAKGAAQGPQPTVKDQLEQKAGIMALMGQQAPAQRPQIPQPEPRQPQPQAEGGIDQLPVKDSMFGMAGGGIVAFNGEDRSDVPSAGTEFEVPGMTTGTKYRDAMEKLKEGKPLSDIEKALIAVSAPFAAAADVVASPVTGLANMVRNPLDESPRPSLTPAMDMRKRAMDTFMPKDERPMQDQSYRRGSLEQARQIMANAVQQGETKPTTSQPAPAPRGVGPTATKPTRTPGGIADSLEQKFANSPEAKRAMAFLDATNPHANPESQDAYLKRINEGIRSQIPGGKMPWETSEERLKGMETRRAKEDEAYQAAANGEGRRMDNLVTMLSNLGAGSFGMGGSQGVRAVQGVERAQREEALKRQDMRDQQAMKIMEIRALNDQAQAALAMGNMQAYEKYTQEARKLSAEVEKEKAVLAGQLAKTRSGAAEEDVRSADRRAHDQTVLQAARISAAGKGEITPALEMRLRVQAQQAADKFFKDNPMKARAADKDPSIRKAKEDEYLRKFLATEGYTTGSPSPGNSAGGIDLSKWGKSSVVKP